MWTDDLITLGYLPVSGTPALARFERHAKRSYRMTVDGASLIEQQVYCGPEDGVPQAEIARWIDRGYRRPVGYFKILKTGQWGSLREDVSATWSALLTRIDQLGGTIDGPYGDTMRPIMKVTTVGASKFSFHMCGRAVDLNQGLGNSRYFVAREPHAADTWWRIYCRTADQSGAQGQEFPGVIVHDFYTHSDAPLPAGFYIDLTAEIERGGVFERIRAQDGWELDTRKSEWWHFQWLPDKQKTFQDEAELVGITEARLRAAGYSDADLDHVPG